jgi:hypothetical protein
MMRVLLSYLEVAISIANLDLTDTDPDPTMIDEKNCAADAIFLYKFIQYFSRKVKKGTYFDTPILYD